MREQPIGSPVERALQGAATRTAAAYRVLMEHRQECLGCVGDTTCPVGLELRQAWDTARGRPSEVPAQSPAASTSMTIHVYTVDRYGTITNDRGIRTVRVAEDAPRDPHDIHYPQCRCADCSGVTE